MSFDFVRSANSIAGGFEHEGDVMRCCRPFIVLLLLLLGFLSPTNVPAQATRDCASDCQIELAKVVSLSDAGHLGILPTQIVQLTRDDAGKFFLPSSDRRSLISFDQNGQINAVLGGSNAQTFAIIANVLAGSDGQLLVYDISKGSLITIDRNFRVAGAMPFRYTPAFVLPPNGYLVANSIRTPAHVGQPLHVLGRDGALLRSFGTDDETYREDEPMKYKRMVTRGSGGTVWSVGPGRYLLEQWDPGTGVRKQQLAVTSTWFKESNKLPASGERPQPIIQAIWEDAGLMWILLRDADLKWRRSSAQAVEGAVSDDEFDATYDSVLEAIDLRTKKVVGSRRFDSLLTTHSPSALVTARRKVSGGGVSLDVWKVRLSTIKGGEKVWREQ